MQRKWGLVRSMHFQRVHGLYRFSALHVLARAQVRTLCVYSVLWTCCGPAVDLLWLCVCWEMRTGGGCVCEHKGCASHGLFLHAVYIVKWCNLHHVVAICHEVKGGSDAAPVCFSRLGCVAARIWAFLSGTEPRAKGVVLWLSVCRRAQLPMYLHS